MFSKIRWRIAFPFAALILLATAVLVPFAGSISCLSTANCVRWRILSVGVILAAAAFWLALYLAERTAAPIRQLTETIERIAAGDTSARMLPQRKDEVGKLINAFNNITEQINNQIVNLQLEIRQLDRVLGNMADGILITDEHSRVQLINPAAMRLVGTTEKDALGHSFAEVVRNHQLIELWQRSQQQESEQAQSIEVGPALFLQAFVSPYRVSRSLKYLVILQDLTRIRRLETVRRDFISNISHELRTPLASLRAVIETLQDGAVDDPPAARHFLGRAEGELDALTQMVEELLELSKIESGQVPLRLTETAVSDLLLKPLDRLHHQAERHQLDLILDLSAGLPPVLADAERVQQVITNLVYNAIKFTPANGSIIVSASQSKKSIEPEIIVSVKDTGVGIHADDLPRIFERFYKSDQARTRSKGGTGLGLAIARHIVQSHGGRIWVKSKEGKGSTFFFTLPISQ